MSADLAVMQQQLGSPAEPWLKVLSDRVKSMDDVLVNMGERLRTFATYQERLESGAAADWDANGQLVQLRLTGPTIEHALNEITAAQLSSQDPATNYRVRVSERGIAFRRERASVACKWSEDGMPSQLEIALSDLGGEARPAREGPSQDSAANYRARITERGIAFRRERPSVACKWSEDGMPSQLEVALSDLGGEARPVGQGGSQDAVANYRARRTERGIAFRREGPSVACKWSEDGMPSQLEIALSDLGGAALPVGQGPSQDSAANYRVRITERGISFRRERSRNASVACKWSEDGMPSQLEIALSDLGGEARPAGQGPSQGAGANYRMRVGERGLWFTRDRNLNAAVSSRRNEDGGLSVLEISSTDPACETPAAPARTPAERARSMPFYRFNRHAKTISFSQVETPAFWFQNNRKIRDLQLDQAGAFGRLADEAVNSETTYLLHDRLYTLWQCLQNVASSTASILEIGVWRGGSSRFLAEAARELGKTGRIYCCDTFAGHPGVHSDLDGRHQPGDFAVDREKVERLLAPYAEVQVIAGPIEQTWGALPDGSFSLIHLDVDLYEPTKFVLERALERLEPNGVIVIDDYGFSTCWGVTVAVDNLARERNDVSLFRLFTGQALLTKAG